MPIKEDNIDQLFKNKHKKRFRLLYVIYFLIGIIFVWGIFRAFNIKIEVEGQKISFAIFILSLVGGFACNIIATWVTEKTKRSIIESDSAKRLNIIKNLAKEDLLIDILKQVNYYDNKYCENYKIRACLKKDPSHENMFICELNYEYKKKYNSRNLIFQFVRIRNEVERTLENNRDVLHSFLNNEFYYVSDERDFFPQTTQVEKDCFADSYKLTHLEITNSDNEVVCAEYEKVIIEGSENICKYEAQIPDEFSIDTDLLTIKYSLEYIIEKDSYTYFSFELPTKGIRVEFDFKDVDEEIDFFALDFLNSHIGPHPLHKPEDKKIILAKKEWILPKSSILFNWYKKQTE